MVAASSRGRRAAAAGGSAGLGTYDGADLAGAPAGSGGADGAGQAVETILASSASRARRTLRESRRAQHVRPAWAESSPPAPAHDPARIPRTRRTPPGCGGRGSAENLLGARQDQKHQKDLVHQESPVQSKEGGEESISILLCSRAGGSAQSHHRPLALTGGPGGPCRPEKPL